MINPCLALRWDTMSFIVLIDADIELVAYFLICRVYCECLVYLVPSLQLLLCSSLEVRIISAGIWFQKLIQSLWRSSCSSYTGINVFLTWESKTSINHGVIFLCLNDLPCVGIDLCSHVWQEYAMRCISGLLGCLDCSLLTLLSFDTYSVIRSYVWACGIQICS